jgi:hypothetical protein
LVISADDGSLPGLRGGDVIVEVAAKRSADPRMPCAHCATNLLGKEVPIRVLRERKSIALAPQGPGVQIDLCHAALATPAADASVAPVPPVPDVPVAAPCRPHHRL